MTGPRVPRKVSNCEGCGASFVQKWTNHQCRFCSHACANRDTQRKRAGGRPPKPKMAAKCEHCGTVFIKKRNWEATRFCSMRCAGIVSTLSRRRPERDCKHCGKTFQPRPRSNPGSGIFCSRPCYFSSIRNPSRSKEKRTLGHGNPRHRAKSAGVVFNRVDYSLIFERDGWKCQLCGIDTPMALRGTKAAAAPEADHMVPLKLGGAHIAENLWCLCSSCNKKKASQAFVPPPSLSLFRIRDVLGAYLFPNGQARLLPVGGSEQAHKIIAAFRARAAS